MKKFMYPAAALVILGALFLLRIQSGLEPSSDRSIEAADVAAQAPTVQDHMLSEIREALQERIQIAPDGDIPQLPFVLGQSNLAPEPEALGRPPFKAQPCFLSLERCGEVFGNIPEPCLLATQRCGGTPEVILLGSVRR